MNWRPLKNKCLCLLLAPPSLLCPERPCRRRRCNRCSNIGANQTDFEDWKKKCRCWVLPVQEIHTNFAAALAIAASAANLVRQFLKIETHHCIDASIFHLIWKSANKLSWVQQLSPKVYHQTRDIFLLAVLVIRSPKQREPWKDLLAIEARDPNEARWIWPKKGVWDGSTKAIFD